MIILLSLYEPRFILEKFPQVVEAQADQSIAKSSEDLESQQKVN
jgi:hypothetical protein